MEFEWDAAKNRLNQDKHRISCEEAAEIFIRPFLMWEDTRQNYEEGRYIRLGEVGNAVVVVLVHTPRGSKSRIISARRANARERKKDYASIKAET